MAPISNTESAITATRCRRSSGHTSIRSVDLDVTAVLTNKCQQGAYRGFGSEVTNFVIERMVDAAVDELGLDPVEFRRKNFIRPEDFPYKIPTGNLYDSGNYAGGARRGAAAARL